MSKNYRFVDHSHVEKKGLIPCYVFDNEEFYDIPGYEGLYYVSKSGKVGSFCKGEFKVLKPMNNGHGYLFVRFWKDGEVLSFYTHRLIAITFLENENNFEDVNHKDENKENNALENLELCTRGYNNNYGTRNARSGKAVGRAVICVETGETFPSAADAARKYGISRSGIVRVCNGRYKTCKGFHWQYV